MKYKVQRPPQGPFTRDDVTWDESNAAHIQAERFLDFVLGESNRINPQTVFLDDGSWSDDAPGHSKSIFEDSLYSEKKRYRCAFGPEESLFVARGNHIVTLGCQCMFEYRKLRDNPNVVCITFKEFGHVDRSGSHCHSTPVPDFMAIHRYAPKISHEKKSWVLSRLQAGLPTTHILAEHREIVLSRMQREREKYRTGKDDFLKIKDMQNVIASVRKGTWKENPHAWPWETRQPLQGTNLNTIPEKQGGTERVLLNSTPSPAELEAQVSTMTETLSPQAPVDLIAEVASEPQSGYNYYASMLTQVREAVKTAQRDLNKRKRQPSPFLKELASNLEG